MAGIGHCVKLLGTTQPERFPVNWKPLRRYCGGMPAARTTSAQRATSLRT
jgi:hypothetical protein